MDTATTKPTGADKKRVEEETSCFSCQLSTVLFGELHCTRSGYAVQMYDTEICTKYKGLGE